MADPLNPLPSGTERLRLDFGVPPFPDAGVWAFLDHVGVADDLRAALDNLPERARSAVLEEATQFRDLVFGIAQSADKASAYRAVVAHLARKVPAFQCPAEYGPAAIEAMSVPLAMALVVHRRLVTVQ